MTTWVPLLALVLGSILTLATTLVSESVKSRELTRKEREERNLRQDEERLLFQQQTLLQLQEAMEILIREAGHRSMSDRADYSVESVHRLEESLMRTRTLQVRVKDEKIRQSVSSVFDQVIDVNESATSEEAVKLMAGVFGTHRRLNERVGEVLRAIL